MKKKKVFIIILCLMSLMVLFSTIKVKAYNYAITSNYTVTCKNNVFTIKRDKVDTSESVFYRTVNKSAVESEHFTRTMGRLDFGVDEDKKTVTVEETAVNDVPIVSRYQTTDRVYGFEVYTADNTVLASCNRTIEYGSAYKFNTQAPTSYNGSYAIYNYSYNRSYNGWDYVYNNNGVDWHYISEDSPNTAYSYYNGLKIYYPTLKTINDKRYYTTITDDGYGQKVYSISLSQLFDCYGVNQEYVAATGVSIFARGFFDIAEIDDGYQYVQVLLDNESTYDSGAKDGDPGKVATSMYMAGFTHYDKGVKPNYATYCVPCRNMNEEPYTGDSVCTMLAQKFNPSYPVATTGESDDYWKIPASTSNIVFRFNASGSGDDDYKVSNLGVELHFVDETRPFVTKVITQVGTYHKGESMTIALKFNEIIHSTSGIGVLHTNVGDFSYSGGVGTNILYFTGYITAEKATSITINSVDSFNYKDLLSFFADESSVIGRGTQVNIDYYQTPGIINGAYQITTRGELLGFLNIVNGTGGKTRNISANAALKNDIKIENFLWTSADIYAGTFDGEGHTITFRVKEAVQDSLGTASGMFTRTLAGSRITNLILSSTISDSKFTGLCNENNGTIDRIKIDIAKNKNYYGSITSPIVCNNKGTITLCVVNDGEFMCTGGDFKSGGICGKNEGTISNCYSMGINVGYSVYKSNIASICLINDGTISNCYTIKNHFGVYTEESHFVLTDNTGNVTPCVVTDEEAKSGKLCYLLNEGVTDGTQAWYQTVSNNMYPVWDNSYETVYCDLDVYSNYPGHNMH
ncbi:MAG: hypothetical protein J5666_03880, partial [Bacilli bacterium]|nr:hypothetical protein [Bacilli bacterium]